MTRKRPDYTEARKYYIKGERNEYPTLQDIATEFNYSLLKWFFVEIEIL